MSPVVQVRPILPCPTCAAHDPGAGRRCTTPPAPQTLALRGHLRERDAELRRRTRSPGGDLGRAGRRSRSRPRICGRPTARSCTAPTLTLSDAHGRHLEGYIDYSGIRSIAVGAGGQLLLNGRVLQPARRSTCTSRTSPTGRGAHAPPSCRRSSAGTRELGGGDHPRALPAQPADRGARRPGRDPAVVRDPGLPESDPAT